MSKKKGKAASKGTKTKGAKAQATELTDDELSRTSGGTGTPPAIPQPKKSSFLSDERYKKDIRSLGPVLARLMSGE